MIDTVSSPLQEHLLDTKPPETLQEALTLYERVYMPSRNFAAKTRVDYRNDLVDLIRFLQDSSKERLEEVSQRDLEAYLAELDRRGYAGTSRKRKTYAFKSFFGFLHQSGYNDVNVTERLIPPKIEQKEPRVLTKREYEALLRASSHHPRDSAIIELLLQTGIRLSEIARLTLDDIELPARISQDPDTVGRLHVVGKGRKDRWIPLNYKACRSLKTWLNVRPETSHDALFVTKFQAPMGPRAFQWVVKNTWLRRGSRGPAFIPSATPLPPTTWPKGHPSEPFRRCWATQTSKQPRSTSNWRRRW